MTETSTTSALDALLDYIKLSRGFDFTGYKRSSLERRIAKRLEAVGADDYVAYRDHLELHPDEFAQLFNTILINVTGFFRDAWVWEHLADTTIPELISAVGDHGPIRVWNAGCSSGEETYSVAMLLAEALGEKAFLERVKIYATDVDDEALADARAATYTDKAVESVPPVLLEKYFERSDRRHVFRKDLRRVVIFGRNDLVQDAPISRIDLLTCRNTLMYFTAETQGRILRRLHFALGPNGRLLVGKSEMLITHSDLFVPQDLKRRLFTPVPRQGPRDRALHALPEVAQVQSRSVRDLAFDCAPSAQLVVDADEGVVAINRQARAAFGLAHGDLGRPLRDLEVSYRPADLRSNIELAIVERRTVVLGLVHHTTPAGDRRCYDVHITPVAADDAVVGAAIGFTDVTVQQHLRTELETSRTELESAYEELQSTVEELETTNEELHSTNEELETMNEELQSSNEELEAINDELRMRTREVDELNAFLETILTTIEIAVVVVDRRMEVQMWNGAAEDMFGLRRGEVRGEALLGLDIGLPVNTLADPLRAVLRNGAGRQDLEVEASDRRGRAFTSRVTVLPLVPDPESAYGAVVLIERAERRSPPRAADAPG